MRIEKLSLIVLAILITMYGNCQHEVLIWGDEFNNSGHVNQTNWSFDLGDGGWGNQELQRYTNSTANVRVENGNLVIDAVKENNEWTSSRINTLSKFSFTFGRIVFRAKLPKGSGTWPALWMLGENIHSVGWPACGEIDVMEHAGRKPSIIQSSVHTPASFGATINTAATIVTSFDTDFHIYEANWTPEQIEFRVDDQWVYSYKPQPRDQSHWPFDKPAFIIINLAMGGSYGSDSKFETDNKKNGVDPQLIRATLEVDYVRVYQFITDAEKQNQEIVLNQTDRTLFISVGKNDRMRSAHILNQQGIEVLKEQSSNQDLSIDASSLPSGIYLINVFSDSRRKVFRIVLL